MPRQCQFFQIISLNIPLVSSANYIEKKNAGATSQPQTKDICIQENFEKQIIIQYKLLLKPSKVFRKGGQFCVIK